MTKLLLIPLEDTVVFPGMDVTLPVDVGDESRVLLVPRHGSDYANVGLVAEVGEHMRLPGRIHAIALSGLHRGIAGAANTDPRAACGSRSTSAPTRRRRPPAPGSSSASTAPWSRRSSSCAATTGA